MGEIVEICPLVVDAIATPLVQIPANSDANKFLVSNPLSSPLLPCSLKVFNISGILQRFPPPFEEKIPAYGTGKDKKRRPLPVTTFSVSFRVYILNVGGGLRSHKHQKERKVKHLAQGQ
jgi:hypothetical protein